MVQNLAQSLNISQRLLRDGKMVKTTVVKDSVNIDIHSQISTKKVETVPNSSFKVTDTETVIKMFGAYAEKLNVSMNVLFKELAYKSLLSMNNDELHQLAIDLTGHDFGSLIVINRAQAHAKLMKEFNKAAECFYGKLDEMWSSYRRQEYADAAICLIDIENMVKDAESEEKQVLYRRYMKRWKTDKEILINEGIVYNEGRVFYTNDLSYYENKKSMLDEIEHDELPEFKCTVFTQENRPVCPKCGEPMSIHAREGSRGIRYICCNHTVLVGHSNAVTGMLEDNEKRIRELECMIDDTLFDDYVRYTLADDVILDKYIDDFHANDNAIRAVIYDINEYHRKEHDDLLEVLSIEFDKRQMLARETEKIICENNNMKNELNVIKNEMSEMSVVLNKQSKMIESFRGAGGIIKCISGMFIKGGGVK